MDNKIGNLVKFPGLVNATMPDDVHGWLDDFNTYAVGSTDLGGWVNTTTEAGSGSSTESIVMAGGDGVGGVILLTTDYAADDFTQLQRPEEFKLAAGKPLCFKARLKLSNAGTAEWFVGLSITDADPLAAGDFQPSDAIGFCGGPTDASADTMLFRCAKNNTSAGAAETDSGEVAIVDDTWFTCEFTWDGNTKVVGYKDGVKIGEHTTNIPNDEVLGALICVNASATGTVGIYVDYVGCWQQR